MTDLYDSEDLGEPSSFERGLPPQLPPGSSDEAHRARQEAINHQHHTEIASLRVGRHRHGNALSRMEGQLTNMRQEQAGMRQEFRAEIEELRVEVKGVSEDVSMARQEVAEIRPDVLRVRKLLAWGGGSGLVILALLEVLGLLRG